MNAVTWVLLVFSVLGALDRILGNRFGLGKEFERGFELFGSMSLSMIGMLVLAPVLANWLQPLLQGMAGLLPIDPSVIPAMLFANDMGGGIHLAFLSAWHLADSVQSGSSYEEAMKPTLDQLKHEADKLPASYLRRCTRTLPD